MVGFESSEFVRILQRYLFREVLQAWIAVTLVLLIILLSNQLASVLSRAANGDITRNVVAVLLWLASIQQLLLLLPIGLFLAIMLALGRLYHESEMAAMQACGVGDDRVFKPVLVLSVFAALILAGLAFVVVPDTAKQIQSIRDEALRQARFASLQPGKFTRLSGGNIAFYAERVDRQGILHNVYAEQREGDKLQVMQSARAEQLGVGTAEQTFVLYDGERYEGVPGDAQFRIIRFVEMRIPIRLPQVAGSRVNAEMKSTYELWASRDLADRAELHTRIASPVMVLMLSFLAVPMARLRPRQGRYARFGHFLLAYFAYQYLLLVGKVWIERGFTPEVLGLWWVHGLVLAVALWWWRRRGALQFGVRRAAGVAA